MIKLFAFRHLQKRSSRIFPSTIIFLVLASIPAISFADNPGFIVIVDRKPISELWLNPGLYSYHFQKDKGLNNSNFGLGGEYRYSTVSSFMLGVFDNSDRQTTHYAGWYWQPLGMGPVRAGAVIGAIDGYPKMLNGGWFLAAIPAASIEYYNFGAIYYLCPATRTSCLVRFPCS